MIVLEADVIEVIKIAIEGCTKVEVGDIIAAQP